MNELTYAPQDRRTATSSTLSNRQAEEAKSAVICAQNFPRDETLAIQRIMTACKRRGLAETAIYSYPKGGTRVEGPSIRLAEAMAQGWGNLDFGVIELEQTVGESVAMSYCWDLETNVKQSKVFTIKHQRVTREKSTLVTDPREVYEMVANYAARRLRACILGIIPGDIQDMAVAQCAKTLKENNPKPLGDRIRDMELAFADLSVTREMLEDKLSYPLTACNENDFVKLRSMYLSIKDGICDRTEFFRMPARQSSADKPAESRTDTLKQKLAANKADKPAADKPAAEKPAADNTDNTDETFQAIRAALLACKTAEDLDAINRRLQPIAGSLTQKQIAELSGLMDQAGEALKARSEEK